MPQSDRGFREELRRPRKDTSVPFHPEYPYTWNSRRKLRHVLGLRRRSEGGEWGQCRRGSTFERRVHTDDGKVCTLCLLVALALVQSAD